MSRDKANFKALENFVKIQNVKFVGGQAKFMVCMERAKLSFCLVLGRYVLLLMLFLSWPHEKFVVSWDDCR